MTEFLEQHTLTADCPLSCQEDQLPARAFGALKRYFQGRRLPHTTVGYVADLYQRGGLGDVCGLGACGIQPIAEHLNSRRARKQPQDSAGSPEPARVSAIGVITRHVVLTRLALTRTCVL